MVCPLLKRRAWLWNRREGLGFTGSSDGKESTCNTEDLGLIPGSERSLEKGMATHSSIFVWEIPWTEEPGGLQSMGLQRVGHDLTTKQKQSIFKPQQKIKTPDLLSISTPNKPVYSDSVSFFFSLTLDQQLLCEFGTLPNLTSIWQCSIITGKQRSP